MAVIDKDEADKRRREVSGVYGKGPSMYDSLMQEIEGLESGQACHFTSKDLPKKKKLTRSRAQSLRTRTNKYLGGKYEFDIVKVGEECEVFVLPG